MWQRTNPKRRPSVVYTWEIKRKSHHFTTPSPCHPFLPGFITFGDQRTNVLPAAAAAKSSTFDLFLQVWNFLTILCSAFVVSRHVLAWPGLGQSLPCLSLQHLQQCQRLKLRDAHQMPRSWQSLDPKPSPADAQRCEMLRCGKLWNGRSFTCYGLLHHATPRRCTYWSQDQDRVQVRFRLRVEGEVALFRLAPHTHTSPLANFSPCCSRVFMCASVCVCGD